jgi:Coenzyme PQQ synthesis protein D (PqqD)
MLLGSSTVVAARQQMSRSVAEESVILDPKAGAYYALNCVAARVWNLIQEPKTVHDIRDAILEEYDVDADGCERDLLGLLGDLAAKELVEVQDETAS